MDANCQQSPIWVRNMNTLPDSAYLFPVKTLTDQNNNVFALSTYYKYQSLPSPIYKVILKKFDSNGNLLWDLDFDNGGVGKPRGFDMAIDDSGNCYIAGGLMDNPNYEPMIMKVNVIGSVLWLRNSTNSFNNGQYAQIILKNNLLYLGCNSGIVVFDLNGIEQWSDPVGYYRIAVDNIGRMLVSTFSSGLNTIFRYNVNGTIDFADSTITADRIAVDSYNNIYLLAQWSKYQLVKLDSNGVFQWWSNAFPENFSFGDQGFELLIDYYNDILLVGLADTMYKYRPDGTMIWYKPMNGLDNYIIDAQITVSNLLAVTGSTPGTQPAGITVSLFNLNGNSIWSRNYQSNIQQEFAVSMAISYDGIYILEDSISNSSLIKFESPFNNPVIDFNLLCVDSVWYEPGNPQLINVRVVNGNIAGLNYPSVQMLSPTGDTISNQYNLVNFFAHAGNYTLVYQDTISVAGISDFSNYSFLISEGFGDTTANIGWCSPVGINELDLSNVVIYPNPANTVINLEFKNNGNEYRLEITSMDGKVCMQKSFNTNQSAQISIESLKSGLYFLKLSNGRINKYFRLIKI